MNQPTVIHQTIEGETVIIHLERGLYYSLDEGGAEIWQALAAGHSPDEVSHRVAARFPAERAEVEAAISALVEHLRTEDLIVPAGDDAANGHVADPGPPLDAGVGGTFQKPRVERFDDLQDLLLLDPIHAVDETGWPDRLETS